MLQQGSGALVRLSSAEEAGRAIEAVNSWAASSGTGFGSFPILVRYADTAEEKARCLPSPILPQDWALRRAHFLSRVQLCSNDSCLADQAALLFMMMT